MRSISTSRQFMQVIFIVLLMGVMAWLATGWQTQQPMQIGEYQDQIIERPYFEAHLITPVTAPVEHGVLEYHRAQTHMHAM